MLQLELFEKVDVEARKVEAPTTVRIGHKVAQIPLARRRREALKKLREVLAQLEGKDIHIGSYVGSGSHFWLNNLKLGRLRLDGLGMRDNLPSVIVLWGSRGASVRIFTNQVVNVREQEYPGYTMWLLDFWNGFREYPIDPFRPRGYTSLHIVRFKA